MRYGLTDESLVTDTTYRWNVRPLKNRRSFVALKPACTALRLSSAEGSPSIVKLCSSGLSAVAPHRVPGSLLACARRRISFQTFLVRTFGLSLTTFGLSPLQLLALALHFWPEPYNFWPKPKNLGLSPENFWLQTCQVGSAKRVVRSSECQAYIQKVVFTFLSAA